MTKPPFIVFTDLDGTLLDHDTYSYSAALPSLNRLKSQEVPVVLASSKTASEISLLRSELGLDASPAIVENGAGVLPAHQAPESTGEAYHALREALEEVPASLRRCFTGFGDLGPEGVADNAGLPIEKARLACQRAFSEPGLWSGTDAELQAFLAYLTSRDISARRGGRYLTLSFGGTKADRMEEIAQLYGAPPMVALGDAPNDMEMLQRATFGFIIANPHVTALREMPGEKDGTIRRSTKIGPEGWNEAIGTLLSEHGLK